MDHWTVIKDSVNGLIAIAAASVALWNYRKNAMTRRAEFLLELHKAFFVEDKYKNIRRALDFDTESTALADLVKEESEELIDFLNFFELVAYLQHSGNLSMKDVNALLEYYLRQLAGNPLIDWYVSSGKNSFEYLNRLLATLREGTKS